MYERMNEWFIDTSYACKYTTNNSYSKESK